MSVHTESGAFKCANPECTNRSDEGRFVGLLCVPCSNVEKIVRETEFLRDISAVINRYSKENDSNTPDFLLAEFLSGCLRVYGRTLKQRDKWFGFDPWMRVNAPLSDETSDELVELGSVSKDTR